MEQKTKPTWQQFLFLKDEDIEEELTKGESELTTPKKISSVIDLSDNIAKKSSISDSYKVTNVSPQLKFLTSEAKINLVYENPMKQLAIYNGTLRTIKISLGDVTTDSYLFLVNANKMAVLPPFNFDRLYLLQEGTITGSIMPCVFAYTEGNIAPNISSI